MTRKKPLNLDNDRIGSDNYDDLNHGILPARTGGEQEHDGDEKERGRWGQDRADRPGHAYHGGMYDERTRNTDGTMGAPEPGVTTVDDIKDTDDVEDADDVVRGRD